MEGDSPTCQSSSNVSGACTPTVPPDQRHISPARNADLSPGRFSKRHIREDLSPDTRSNSSSSSISDRDMVRPSRQAMRQAKAKSGLRSQADDDTDTPHSTADVQRTAIFEELTRVPRDPRSTIESLIIESGEMSVNLEEIEHHLQWEACYEDYYGPLHDYLLGYQSIFIVSPVVDSVALRSHAVDVTTRRSTKPKKRQSQQNLTMNIGSLSYSSIAESFDLDGLEPLYRNRGYSVTKRGEVLHVVAPGRFDLMMIDNGVVVWWGKDRADHWIVDDDFLQDASIVCTRHCRERHWQKDITALFPIWCTFEYDKRSVDWNGRHAVDEEAMMRFTEKLCFDHYLIPSEEPLRSQVMLAVSFSLSRSAKVDYLEHVTQASQKAVMAVPTEPRSLLDHFSARKKITQLEGELRVTQMTITALHDTPDFLWDMPHLRGYFVLTDNQNSVQPRRDWFLARSDALFQKLQSIQGRRHRLFMMSSDVFLIILLVLDVVAMLMRLSVKMFFPSDT